MSHSKLKVVSILVDILNQLYAEDGIYQFWTLLDVEKNWWIFQEIEVDGVTGDIKNNNFYQVKDVDHFVQFLEEQYNKDGGDEEYEKMENWVGLENVLILYMLEQRNK